MSKTIRVEEDVYRQLEELRDWKETFSQVIGRLLKVYTVIEKVSDTLGPGHYLKQRSSPHREAVIREADRR